MISFGHIISEAGYDVKEFPKLIHIPAEILNRKDHEIMEEKEFDFNKKLFSRNLSSQKRFRAFLEALNTTSEVPNKICGKLDDTMLTFRVSGWAPKFFLLF